MKFFPAPCLLVILAVIPLKTLAADENDAELIRSMQRQQHIDAELLTDANVRFEQPLEKNNYVLSEDETPCTRVNYISLDDKTARKFSFLPSVLMKETAFKTGMCLGSNNLSRLQKAAQQILIVRGYLTSQAIIQPQNMDSGILKLRVSAGEIGDIRYEEKRDGKSAEGSISAFNNKFPLYRNKILNLRDVEQGLENLRRLSSVKTDIQIIPSEEEGKSDLQIKWQQNKPIRFSIGIDDAGGKTTGKYQGNVALSFDNPLGLSDLFYVSYGRGLAHKTDLTDATGTETASGSRSYSVHYSVPVKKWLFSFNHNGHRYHEATEGYSVNYDYNGKQYQSSLAAERMLWRNRFHKTSVGMKLWTRQTYKYIDDAEIEVQRRRSAGWEAELRHRAYLNRWQLDGKLSYKRGTGMRQSMPAPEENGGGTIPGTSRMKIITAGLDAAAPFMLGKQQFSYETAIHAQWNKTPLVAQDKLSIGSRYTVRGFDGEQSLSGERGFYWQNTLGWHFHPRHQFYLGADYGRVSGESAQYASGKRLAGAVAGFRGSHKVGGIFAYDLFAGKPLHKPEGFQTANTVYGFNLNYSF
ncbi:TPA: two-partner secretion system transporter HrpB [Neisseria meningitidis]|uniref:two-partner secretion system transporter HrpB n=1 Tax=Neisseria TaxID=482 RepID=UPI00025E2013|nr:MULTISPECIES: two-partner secretion system transporter HrpB [Neisseria]EHP14769.1 hemolysin secretion/activation protein, ShlB family [Neisseria meningitidis NM233]EJU77155.1 tpsA activation/secretion protein TpsB [Neisseria meningitidis NM3001]EOC62845.1 hemolysin secretion/activation ShlB/FhaC/HecB family protein [Neisseria meningitidis NM3042]EOC75497.1 hemolysin secretion/activation ShlB/FhaC/HecB family protein [Neisseria meningitidis NM51]EOC78026.1 hemolysin secretion/activation ShlB